MYEKLVICFLIVIDTRCRLTRHITSNCYRMEIQPRYPTSTFIWIVNLAKKTVWNWMLSGWQESVILKSKPWRWDSSFNIAATECFRSLKSIYWTLFNRVLCTNSETVTWFFKYTAMLIFWSASEQATYYTVPIYRQRNTREVLFCFFELL